MHIYTYCIYKRWKRVLCTKYPKGLYILWYCFFQKKTKEKKENITLVFEMFLVQIFSSFPTFYFYFFAEIFCVFNITVNYISTVMTKQWVLITEGLIRSRNVSLPVLCCALQSPSREHDDRSVWTSESSWVCREEEEELWGKEVMVFLMCRALPMYGLSATESAVWTSWWSKTLWPSYLWLFIIKCQYEVRS